MFDVKYSYCRSHYVSQRLSDNEKEMKEKNEKKNDVKSSNNNNEKLIAM